MNEKLEKAKGLFFTQTATKVEDKAVKICAVNSIEFWIKVVCEENTVKKYNLADITI